MPPRLIALYGEHPAFEPFDAWLGAASEAPLADPPQLTDDVLQLYTSGTTGLPKGVVLTNANYRAFLEAATEVDGFAYGEDETVMIVMPLFHVAGTNVSFSGLAQGGRLVLVEGFHRRRRGAHDARGGCRARFPRARDDPDDAAPARSERRRLSRAQVDRLRRLTDRRGRAAPRAQGLRLRFPCNSTA